VTKNGKNITFNNYPLKTPYQIDNVTLSLVIPAYNEATRLPIALADTIKYFKGKLKFEVVIVNDGSTDNTWDIILAQINKYKDIDIIAINYPRNFGKGHAVIAGMKHTRGSYILMLDADGATQISDYDKLKSALKDDNSIAIGSRNHLVQEVVSKRAWYRNSLMHINNLFVHTLIGINKIKDTQCGFKLFSRKSAHNIFFKMHLLRWAWDVEMLYIAGK
jgi:dolichyl-phosphate beta-glucosyltransferase